MGDALRAMHISPVGPNTVTAGYTGAKPLAGQPWRWVNPADRERTDATIGAIKQLLDLIRYKLNDLFDSNMDKDDGLDHETQLPDRRYRCAFCGRCTALYQLLNDRIKG